MFFSGTVSHMLLRGKWYLTRWMFLPIVGTMIQSDELIFFRGGWNQQPVLDDVGFIKESFTYRKTI